MFLFRTVGLAIVTYYSEIDGILYFVSLAFLVKFQASETNKKRELESRQLSLCASSVLFFFSFQLLACFHDLSNAHTHTNKGGAREETRKGRKDRNWKAVRFTRFVDYRLMFNSRRSVSL